MDFEIRLERERDYFETETVTREAFWNLFVEGCDEHFLAHKMRSHVDFLSNLNFVALSGDKIIGNIMYTKSYVLNENNQKIETITFGPISVLPSFQRQGVGSALIQHSIQVARANNYHGIIIQGYPHNYCKHGFKSSKDFNISNSEGKYPFSLLVLELKDKIFSHTSGKYYASPVYDISHEEAIVFDSGFPKKKKEYQYSQEEFSIACRAYLV